MSIGRRCNSCYIGVGVPFLWCYFGCCFSSWGSSLSSERWVSSSTTSIAAWSRSLRFVSRRLCVWSCSEAVVVHDGSVVVAVKEWSRCGWWCGGGGEGPGGRFRGGPRPSRLRSPPGTARSIRGSSRGLRRRRRRRRERGGGAPSARRPGRGGRGAPSRVARPSSRSGPSRRTTSSAPSRTSS